GVNGAAACSPAALPDGRILLSLDRAGRGDFGLYALRADGSRLTRVVDLPGTLELDAVPLVARKLPPVLRALLTVPLPDLPFTEESQLHDLIHTFRFDCL